MAAKNNETKKVDTEIAWLLVVGVMGMVVVPLVDVMWFKDTELFAASFAMGMLAMIGAGWLSPRRALNNKVDK